MNKNEMPSRGLSLEQRQAILEKYIAKYLKRGYQFISHSATTAELYKPQGFPALIFREQTLLVDVDLDGTIYVTKV